VGLTVTDLTSVSAPGSGPDQVLVVATETGSAVSLATIPVALKKPLSEQVTSLGARIRAKLDTSIEAFLSDLPEKCSDRIAKLLTDSIVARASNQESLPKQEVIDSMRDATALALLPRCAEGRDLLALSVFGRLPPDWLDAGIGATPVDRSKELSLVTASLDASVVFESFSVGLVNRPTVDVKDLRGLFQPNAFRPDRLQLGFNVTVVPSGDLTIQAASRTGLSLRGKVLEADVLSDIEANFGADFRIVWRFR
jgi:hypothetical protein